MENKLVKEITIQSGFCDFTGRLGFTGCANLFIDSAGEHAEKLGIGMSTMGRENKFWTVYKTRIDFFDRPKMLEEVTLTTWPEKPSVFMGVRNYTLSGNGRTLCAGKTQWVVVDTVTGKPQNMKNVYPADMIPLEDHAIDEPFERFTGGVPEQVLGKYTVRSTDIDIGHHMNNVAYIRATEGLFSTKELKYMDLKSIEIHYQKSCYEGDELEFRVDET
ncbi:MAG: thioesterase, partial [Clostridia bacterium]|nr:thioesterase [Clostridia bacterium]